MIEYKQHTFKNGLRLIHIQDQSLVAHFGVVFGTGSRDELIHEHGMAHFIEHMLFKGTKTRKPYHILSRMEDVGGEIDAYTTKEFIVLNSSFPKQYFSRAVELIADLTFNSTFPEKELKNEKEVVAEEIKMYKDSPSELIFDLFDEYQYADHPMGRNILGSVKSLKKFTPESTKNYWNRQIDPKHTIVCSAGDLNLKQVIHLMEKHFSDFPENSNPIERHKPPVIEPFNEVVKKKTYQAHCIMGTTAFGAKSPHRLNLLVLTNLLGGPGMNSRLNLMLREKHGMVYQVEAFYDIFSDCGNFGVYFGSDADNLEKCRTLITKEITKLAECKLGPMQIHNAKRQLLGQIILGSENKSSLIISAAKSLLIHDRIWSTPEIVYDVESITETQLQDTANEIFTGKELSSLLIL
ncbi:MAG: pitrilysin family protein [Salinivirgaceae bacterium]|nr:pitrilysin family protein [Salinivirgaceae bacterium]